MNGEADESNRVEHERIQLALAGKELQSLFLMNKLLPPNPFEPMPRSDWDEAEKTSNEIGIIKTIQKASENLGRIAEFEFDKMSQYQISRLQEMLKVALVWWHADYPMRVFRSFEVLAGVKIGYGKKPYSLTWENKWHEEDSRGIQDRAIRTYQRHAREY